ncbi:MAG: YaeQ family protein [Burkholderiales bacterium]
MALKATIFKAQVAIADMDRGYYAEHALTLARHPSETDERLMLRITAFALNAHERLEFGKGLSDEDEPSLWQKTLTGIIENWIEVGQPDVKRLRKACGRANAVCVYSYGRGAEMWWKQSADELARHQNLSVWSLPADSTQALARLADRGMQLQFTIQEGIAFVSNTSESIQIEPQQLKFAET